MYLAAIGLLLLALVEAERRDWLKAVIAKVRGACASGREEP